MATFTFAAEDVVNAVTLQDLQQATIDMLDDCCRITILAGFDHELNDITYHFSYLLTDQANFATMTNHANVSLSIASLSEKERENILGVTYGVIKLPAEWLCSWNAHRTDSDSVEVLTLNLSEFLDLSAAATYHNQETLGKFRKLKERVLSAKDENDLIGIKHDINLEKIVHETTVLAGKYNLDRKQLNY